MRVLPQNVARPRLARQGRIITSADPEFGFAPLCASGGASASGAWTSANDPVGIPFTITDALVVTHLGWRNGSAAGSNHDIGIYDESWNRLVSTGSVASGTSSQWNFVDVTDTPLAPGRYYIVKVIDATTANRARFWSIPTSLVVATMCGLKESATDSFPLPNPLVGMTDPITITRVPVVSMHVKAPLA